MAAEAKKRATSEAGIPAAVELGAMIREAREAQAGTIADIANELKLRRSYLEAIEAGRFDELPGTAYAIGYIRTYSDFLGLESEEVVRRYKDVAGGGSHSPSLVPPSPVEPAGLPTGAILLVALILAAAAYGAWYYFGQRDAAAPPSSSIDAPLAPAAPSQDRPSPPQSMAPATPVIPGAAPGDGTTVAPPAEPASGGDAADATADAASGEAAGSDQIPRGDADAAPDTAADAPGTPSIPAAAAAAAAAASVASSAAPAGRAAGSAAPAGTAGSHITIRALADSWVEVTAPGGQKLISRVMRSGETFAVPPVSGATLDTGNAGGLEITVDGRPAASLGEQGIVRRGFALDTLTGPAARDAAAR